jgi:hypothetical protein
MWDTIRISLISITMTVLLYYFITYAIERDTRQPIKNEPIENYIDNSQDTTTYPPPPTINKEYMEQIKDELTNWLETENPINAKSDTPNEGGKHTPIDEIFERSRVNMKNISDTSTEFTTQSSKDLMAFDTSGSSYAVIS